MRHRQLILDITELNKQIAIAKKRKRELTRRKRAVTAKITKLKSKELLQLEKQECKLAKELEQASSHLRCGLLPELENVSLVLQHTDIKQISKQSKQSRASWLAIMHAISSVTTKDMPEATLDEVYSKYSEVCKTVGLSPLTQRRVSSLLSELDMRGLVNISTGKKTRYGWIKKVSLVRAYA